MNKILIAVLGLFAMPAFAADMPIKALPRQPILFSYAGSGFYLGIGTFAEVDKAKISTPVATVDGFAAGGSVNATAGWMWGNGTTWNAIEGNISYQNVGPSAAIGGNINSRFGFTQRVLWGGPITAALNLLPNLSTVFPVLPTPIAATTTHPYIFAALHEDDVSADFGFGAAKVWRFRAGVGAGLKQQLGSTATNPNASQVTADIWAEYLMQGTGITVGAPVGLANVNQGQGARVGITLEY